MNTSTTEIIPFVIKKGTFPRVDFKTPLLLIATGTGISPLRSVLRERFNHAVKNPDDLIGKTILVFGCRNKNKDFLYSNEYEEYSSLKNMK